MDISVVVIWYVFNTFATVGVGYGIFNMSDEITLKDLVILLLLLIIPIAPIMGLMFLAESDAGSTTIIKRKK